MYSIYEISAACPRKNGPHCGSIKPVFSEKKKA
jgi:hypothetical protein